MAKEFSTSRNVFGRFTPRARHHSSRAKFALIKSLCCAAIDRDRSTLNMAGPLRAKEKCQCRDIIRMTEPLQSVPCEHFAAQIFDRTAARGGAPRQNVMRTLGVGRTRMDDVDVHAVVLAEMSQALGKISHCSVDRTSDQKIQTRRTRRGAYDVYHVPPRILEHRP